MSTIIVLIFRHKIIVLSAAECNPYPKKCVFVRFHHTTPQHSTRKNLTAVPYVAIPTALYGRLVSLRYKKPSYLDSIQDSARFSVAHVPMEM
jgi:hypothetical protein